MPQSFLARGSLLVVLTSLAPVACSEHKIIKVVQSGEPPAAADEEPTEEETPDDAGAKPPSDPLDIDLGEVTTGQDVSFEVPAGAVGFNIVGEIAFADFDLSTPFGIERIVAPDGTVVHDEFTPAGGTIPTSTAAFDSIASASVPQSENTPKQLGGTWKVRFGFDGATTKTQLMMAKVRVQSTGDGAFHGGKLDLHLHLPKGVMIRGKTIDPATASTNATVADVVDDYFTLTGALLGIERGKVSFHTESSTLAELDDEEIIRAFAVSDGEKDGTQALHVLFTNAIRSQGELIAAGIAPGIPGAANLFGRGVSGIIVTSMDDGFHTGDHDALTMLHETGHFIGLNHTTELDGNSADPLKDTPRCTNISGGDLFSCPDRSNIMFAASALDGTPSLSPTQVRVYRGSPVYQALLAEAPQTRSLQVASAPTSLRSIHRSFHASGRALSRVESELAAGSCGLTPIDASGMVSRYGRASAEAELRAAAADTGLSSIVRGRARLALKQLGVTP